MSDLRGGLSEDMIPVGRIVKPHGLRGEMKAKISLEDEEVFRGIEDVLLYNEKTGSQLRVSLDGVRKAAKGWIVHFDGVDSMVQAERFVGFHIYIERQALPELGEGEYYYFQILGCSVYDEKGRLIGMVNDIIDTGANDVMVVVRDQKDLTVKEELIPLIKDYIVELNLDGKAIVAKTMEFEEVKSG